MNARIEQEAARRELAVKEQAQREIERQIREHDAKRHAELQAKEADLEATTATLRERYQAE